MMSAVNTSDEIAAAAVARGIENPCPKSNAVQIRMSCIDWMLMALVTTGVAIVLAKMS